MRISVYIHVYTINNWEVILTEILSSIIYSGLYETVQNIRLCMHGVYSEEVLTYLIGKYTKIKAIPMGDGTTFEWLSLKKLWDDRTEYDYVLYLHTKSVSSYDVYDVITHNWRRYMLWVNIKNYNAHLQALRKDYSVSGTLYLNKQFLAGNFWWATASHIKRLSDPLIVQKETLEKNRTIFESSFMRNQKKEHIEGNRWGCELWVCNFPGCKINSIQDSNPTTFREWDN